MNFIKEKTRLDNRIIKSIKEKTVKISENKSEFEYELTFETSKQGVTSSKNIILSGNGSLKVLTLV